MGKRKEEEEQKVTKEAKRGLRRIAKALRGDLTSDLWPLASDLWTRGLRRDEKAWVVLITAKRDHE